MLRVPGGTVYEDERVLRRAATGPGILVWQDAMLGFRRPARTTRRSPTPWCAEVDRRALGGRRATRRLAVFCGGQELEEQPAMFGLPRERWAIAADPRRCSPTLVDRLAPGLPYVPSSPTGGDLPFQVDAGRQPLLRGGGVPLPARRPAPVRRPVRERGAGLRHPPRAGHASTRCSAAPRRPGHESGLEAGRPPRHRGRGSTSRTSATTTCGAVRRRHRRRSGATTPSGPSTSGRAAVAEVMAAGRSPSGAGRDRPCAGFLAMALRDLRAGARLGLVDAFGPAQGPLVRPGPGVRPGGRPGHRRRGSTACPPSGQRHRRRRSRARLVVGLHTAAHRVEEAARAGGRAGPGRVSGPRRLPVRRLPRPDLRLPLRPPDLRAGHRRPGRRLGGGAGRRRLSCPVGRPATVEPDVGLQAALEPADGGAWPSTITARRFAQYVHVDVPGFVAGRLLVPPPARGEPGDDRSAVPGSRSRRRGAAGPGPGAQRRRPT